jgi:hypothetical protein
LGLIWSVCASGFTGKVDAVGVVNEVVEDGVGEGRVAEHGAMP